MGDSLKPTGRRSSGGWFSFWAAVLLILPNCSFDGSGPDPNLDPGPEPHSGAMFCDVALERRCATPGDLAMGTRLASAAVALVAGRPGTNIGLDDSPAALAACAGLPQAVVFHGSFPQGSPVCVNCGGNPHGIARFVCQAKCYDLFGSISSDGTMFPANPPSQETIAFCTANALISTNFPFNGCFEGACTMAGTLLADFADPRRIPEPVNWTNLNGVSAAGGSLTRTLAATGNYDANASSSQVIGQVLTGGDAYLEFTATETNTARVAGLSSGFAPPGGISFVDVGFGILLTETGEIFVVENGSLVSSFGAYAGGQKFRVKLHDRFDGTATVFYARIDGPCTDGSPCNEVVFHASTSTATFPVRVDAMFRDLGATITEARIVRIR